MRVAEAILTGFLVLWLPFAGICRFQLWTAPVCGVELHPKYQKAMKRYDKWKMDRQQSTKSAKLKVGQGV